MTGELKVSIGHYSDKGRKEVNQDFHGALFPDGEALALKGVTVALADGISSSPVSQVAAESAIKSLLSDYYCTSETWSVKTSAQRVINATNSWAHAQTKRSLFAHDMDRGFVCTLSAMIIKGHHAHLFHIGDGRIYRLVNGTLEQLTNDHRARLSASESYLARAIGMAPNVEIDYRRLKLSVGDVFVLATDGAYDYFEAKFVAETIGARPDDLDEAARLIGRESYARGSPDNITVQIVRIDALPDGDAIDLLDSSAGLKPPPLLQARQEFEGYRIIRQIHASSRSHIYLAADLESGEKVALKIPSIDLRDDAAYLKRFILEEWVARRIDSAHVLKAVPRSGRRNYIYVASEYVEGQTLAQWMIDNPRPDIETVRGIIEQIARGVRAFHRKEMLHQDLRPGNIMIDRSGTVKIIDFGSTKVAGVAEAGPNINGEEALGTLQYMAPEYFVGDPGTRQSDFYSLGVIAYQMLSGHLPYGTQVARLRKRSQQMKLRYSPARRPGCDVPDWVDGALRKAVHPDPFKRYGTLSEFITDLRTPNRKFISSASGPLSQRNPVMFWQAISLVLAVITVILLAGT